MTVDKSGNIDFNEWKVPTRWEDLTLGQFQDIERLYKDKEDKTFDTVEALHILCGKTKDEVNALPIDFLDKILMHLSFLTEPPSIKDPSNKVSIKGVEYKVNTQEKMKVGEYLAVDTILKEDPYNYAAILAVLCRREGEEYDTKFENEVVPSRMEMFASIPMMDVMPMVNFFLLSFMALRMPTLLSSKAMEAISRMRHNIESLHRNGALSRLSMKSAMRTLRKYEKTIKSISTTT